MAMKTGRCPNCGSLLNVNNSDEQAACMFCYAVFAPSEAIKAELHPEEFTFPNEKQPAPTDEVKALAFSNYRNVRVDAPAAPAVVKTTKLEQSEKLTPAEKVALQSKVIIEPKMSRKHKIMLPLTIVAIVAVLVVIFLPLTKTREAKRDELVVRMNEIDHLNVPSEDYFFFSGFRNTSLLLVSPDTVTEEDAEQLLQNFEAVRSDVYGLDDGTEQHLKIRLAGENGAYLVNRQGDIVKTN